MFKIPAWTRYLAKPKTSNQVTFTLYAILAAFATYFCMYAYRKTFTVGTFEGVVSLPFLPEMDYKILLVISQVFGYALSKILGIKIISELSAARRAFAIIVLIALAEVALLLFALTPMPYNVIFLLMNGLPLGMVWGLVFGFLEGRRQTEALGAGLSVSYIVASGAVKTVGKIVMSYGVSEFWMPFVTGLFFFPILLLFVWMLSLLPEPNAEDEAQRTKRAPMFKKDRARFFWMFAPGLIALTFLYIFLTAYRDFRDNFAREIWDALGYESAPWIFTVSEIPIALVVMVALGILFFIKNNQRAFFIIHYLMMAGAVLIGLSTLAFQMNMLSGAMWMVLVGLGLYLGYVPYGCFIFDRLIAVVGIVATAGFMIYVVDAFGYLGSVGLLLYKNFGQPDLSWLAFFTTFSLITAGVSLVFFTISLVYFKNKSAMQSA